MGSDQNNDAPWLAREIDAPQGANLVGRPGIERLINPAQLEQCHDQAPPDDKAPRRDLARPANIVGTTRAANTKAAVISFRSFGSSPQRSASATISRNRSDPRAEPAIDRPTPPAPTRAWPRMTLARPQTIMPMPIWMSANP